MIVSTPVTFLSANPTEYLVSTVDGTMLLKGLILAKVRLLSTRKSPSSLGYNPIKKLTISPNIEVFFDLPNVDVLDRGYLDLTLKLCLLVVGFVHSCLWVRSCTSRSRYQSVSKQTTRYHKLDSYRIKQDFHLHCEYLSITRMFWQDLKDNA
ncbi:hypothetical protein Tco_0300642 [Tanacetum coccineum]